MPKGLGKLKPSQLYFGRYLTFFLLSQVQTFIIVLGDLYLLKIQCVHPVSFIADRRSDKPYIFTAPYIL